MCSKRYTVLDIETNGLEVNSDITLIGILEFDSEEDTGIYKIYHMNDELERAECLEHMRNIKGIIGHNAKFDAKLIKYSYDIDLEIKHDTMYLSYICSNVYDLEYNRGKWLGLKDAAMRELKVADWDIDLKTKKSGVNIEEYLKNDLLYTRKLFEYYKNNIDKKDELTYFLMVKAANAYKDIELNGIYIDTKTVAKLVSEFNMKLNEVDFRLKSYADINYCSTKQLQSLLFNDYDLPIVARTKKGAPSTGVSALKELKGKHDIIELILEKRNIDKALTFLKDWKDKAINNRLYANFNLHTTITGRTSSNHPNIQQVPRNKELKKLFTAPNGYKFVQIDYSQIELRIAAAVAGVSSMIESYKNGEDLHTKMARVITGKEEISKADRTGAKAASFGYLYGMIAKTFVIYAKDTYGIDVSIEEATAIRNKFFESNKELIPYYKHIEEELLRNGYITNIFGRRYKVGFDNLKLRSARNLYIRKGINFSVQSTASDYVLMALIEIHNKYKHNNDIRIVGTVHDSILLEVKDNEHIITNIKDIKNIMEHPKLLGTYLPNEELPIPIIADVEIGPWGSGVPLED